MKKIIILTALCVLMLFSFTGCKSDEVQLFTYEASGVTGIEIETGANAVTITRNSGSNIEVFYTKDVAEIKDGILQINIPMPGAGVNFKEPAAVIISVPDALFEAIQIKSEVGSVTIEDINTDKLTIETQYGDITLSGTKGRISAKSELGSIKTELAISSGIESLGKEGQKLEVQVDDSENILNLYTNVGMIELK